MDHEREAAHRRHTPDMCRRLIETLVERDEQSGGADLTFGPAALERCTGPLPGVSEPDRRPVELLLEKETVRQPYPRHGTSATRTAAECSRRSRTTGSR